MQVSGDIHCPHHYQFRVNVNLETQFAAYWKVYSIHVGVRYIGIRIATPQSPGAWATSLTIDLNIPNRTRVRRNVTNVTFFVFIDAFP